MKRILLGLLVIGLAFSIMIGCQMPTPADSADQTQVSSTKLTVTSAGYFGEEISETVYSTGSSADDTAEEWAVNNPSRYTLTFKTDGTWEYMLEMYEDTLDPDDVNENWDGDAFNNEGEWVKVDAYKGTYSYDSDTMTLTVSNSFMVWDAANAEYDPQYDNVTTTAIVPPANDIVDTQTYTYMVDGTINTSGFVTIDYAGANATADTMDDLFEGDATAAGPFNWTTVLNGSFYMPGGTLTTTVKYYDSGDSTDWVGGTDVEYYTTTNQLVVSFDDANDSLTWYYRSYNDDPADGSVTNTYPYSNNASAADRAKHVVKYTKTPDYDLSSGSPVGFSSAVETLTYPESAVVNTPLTYAANGSYAWSTDKAEGAGSITTDSETASFVWQGVTLTTPTVGDGYVEVFNTSPLGAALDTFVDVSGSGDYLAY